MTQPIEMQMFPTLLEDSKKMRVAGGELAEAAIYVVTHADGCHRLSLAIAKWCKVIADESNRGVNYSVQEILTDVYEHDDYRS